jgi:hypothetical protein
MFLLRPSRLSAPLPTLSLRSARRALVPFLSGTSISISLLATSCGGTTEAVSKDVCKSGTRWTGGDTASEEMNPGQPCLDCHARNDGPRFAAGGTVFADLKQANNCFGLPEVEVHVVDATGKTLTTKANAAGNFYFEDAIAMPYSASIVFNGTTLPMGAKPTTGDCNACHTKNGTKLGDFAQPSGRIYFPVQ